MDPAYGLTELVTSRSTGCGVSFCTGSAPRRKRFDKYAAQATKFWSTCGGAASFSYGAVRDLIGQSSEGVFRAYIKKSHANASGVLGVGSLLLTRFDTEVSVF